MRAFLGFLSAFVLLLTFSVLSRSATLASESIHAFFDLIVVYLTISASKRLNRRDSLYTYGMHRLEVLYSLLNVLVVVVGVVVGAFTSVIFLLLNVEDNPELLIISSLLAFLLSLFASTEEVKGELERGVRVHALLDSAVYLGGSLVGIAVALTHVFQLDPLSSLLMLAIVALLSEPNLRESVYTLMERSPVNVGEVESSLQPVLGNVHHVHVWSICPHMRVATLHAEDNPEITLEEMDRKREEAERVLREKFSITHVTIQFETKRRESDS
ncbi:cation transporter [Metallosphaera tengchongensis]|uniref:Cation transporter n=1 Tax=Metallosphaera tengchongensis TaxID=1532350 RepID=A0A6N0NWS7_9CREN|nr:cation diffusion facilitator family transporter [Metallosphaera tengchongensis]QKR00677.1 cation transporter [Metallosphaera tengchongensis]